VYTRCTLDAESSASRWLSTAVRSQTQQPLVSRKARCAYSVEGYYPSMRTDGGQVVFVH